MLPLRASMQADACERPGSCSDRPRVLADPPLLAPVPQAWLFSLYCIYLVIKYSKASLALRQRELSESAGVEAYSVLVQAIPKELSPNDAPNDPPPRPLQHSELSA